MYIWNLEIFYKSNNKKFDLWDVDINVTSLILSKFVTDWQMFQDLILDVNPINYK